jgi:nucleoside-diphosphate-sugar epimerase
MKNLLITGISGYFGALLIPWLKNYDGNVYYFIRGGRERFRKLFGFYRSQDSFYDIDLCIDSASGIITNLEAVGDRPNKIIHLAADVRFGEEQRDDVMKTNLGGTEKIIEVAKQFGAELIYFSTYYVHGAWPENVRFTEDFIYCEPKNPYEESKQKSEIAVRDSGLDYKIIRPSILADCLDSGYCGLLRYFWLISDYYRNNPSRMANGISLVDGFLNLPLEGDYYLQKTTLNFIVGDWVGEVMPKIIMSGRKNLIIHLINENPPVSEACFADAFANLRIKAIAARDVKHPHNMILERTVLRIFRYYLESHPLPDCSNLKKVVGRDYKPHPQGVGMQTALARILAAAVENKFGLSEKEIIRLGRVFNI